MYMNSALIELNLVRVYSIVGRASGGWGVGQAHRRIKKDRRERAMQLAQARTKPGTVVRLLHVDLVP